MEELDMKIIWQLLENKIAKAEILNHQSWVLNFQCFESIQKQKTKSTLNALVRFKLFAIVLGLLWILFLGILLWGDRFTNPYFSISTGIILLITVYVVAIYLRHIILINQISYEGNILGTQSKLAKLKASTLYSTRISWLQMPFYTTWFWSTNWIMQSGANFWLIAFPITLLFTLLAGYLFFNLNERNMHKNWVKTLLMSGPEYRDILQSINFMKEIEDYKKDQIVN